MFVFLFQVHVPTLLLISPAWPLACLCICDSCRVPRSVWAKPPRSSPPAVPKWPRSRARTICRPDLTVCARTKVNVGVYVKQRYLNFSVDIIGIRCCIVKVVHKNHNVSSHSNSSTRYTPRTEFIHTATLPFYVHRGKVAEKRPQQPGIIYLHQSSDIGHRHNARHKVALLPFQPMLSIDTGE